MEIIYVISFKLSELLKINEAQAIGVFTLAIKDGNKKMGSLSYEDCREVIQVHLKERLKKIGTPNPDSVIGQLTQLLAQKQSLFVMMAR
jgi:hypothetical protein